MLSHYQICKSDGFLQINDKSTYKNDKFGHRESVGKAAQ